MNPLEGWLRPVERQAGQMLLVIYTDNAAEFAAMMPWGESRGIEFGFIEIETLAQNGVAEWFNRIILEIARALLFDARISKKYWKYAVVTANYLRNRTTLMKESADKDDHAKMTMPNHCYSFMFHIVKCRIKLFRQAVGFRCLL